jgi:prepilin-type N-terminal cleavage/methylation domain-containing protein
VSVRAHGFTLIELLISVAVLGIVSVYMFESFAVNQRAYTVIDQVAESQQSVRAIADLLERDLRHAGLMIPEGTAVCGIDATTAPDVLYVSDAGAIDPGDDVATYEGASIGGTQVADGAIAVSSLVMEPAPSRPAYDTDANGVADSDFREGAGVIVMDAADPSRGAACGRVTDVDLAGPQLTIDYQSGGLAGVGAGAQLIIVPAHEYRIANGDQLLRDGVLLAEGVEDLQVAYFYDKDTDNVVDADEMRGVPGDNYDASAQDTNEVREVRVNLVTRTRMEDREWSQGTSQALENRAAGVASDGFRRRTYTSTVMLRNLGARSL